MTLRPVTVLCVALLALSCTATGGEGSADDRDEVILLDGKGDDFYSISASEYWVSGPARLHLESGDRLLTGEARDRRIDELAALNNLRISWFLNEYLTTKEPSNANHGYGGFGGMARFYSEEGVFVTVVDDSTIEYEYRVQVAGSPQLMSLIPGVDMEDGRHFELKTGVLSNEVMAQLDMNEEWYRRAPWAEFDPSSLPQGLVETLQLKIKPQDRTLDSYLPYDRLFADGELTIGIHTGWDYHDRYDVSGARSIYQWLIANGYDSPTGFAFDKYEPSMGPLTRAIQANGKRALVKVWLFHPGDAANGVAGPDPDTATGGLLLEKDMRESFATREVIMFLGHSGPLYGFALANWKKTDEGDIDDSEIATLEMPADTFQLVLANGCDTYGLGQAFWRNPAKADHKNLNVITTTSFSNAGTARSAIGLLNGLTRQVDGRLKVAKLSELVSTFDAAQGSRFQTMFGVHGAEANPRHHPFSDASYLCRSCDTDADCGPEGNRCTKYGEWGYACSLECLDDSGCPDGYACRRIASLSNTTILTRQCVTKALSCDHR